jgi:FKBP-type peptidyl-prolyl cis-trans isomerase
MGQNQMQAGIRSSMGADMQQLDKLKASEDARLAQMQAAINLEEVRGAQQAAADAQKAAAMATAQGWEGIGKVGAAVTKAAPLFSKKKDDKTTTDDGATAERPPVTPETAPSTNNGTSINIQQGGTTAPWNNPLLQFPMQQQPFYSQNPFQPNWLSPPTYQG